MIKFILAISLLLSHSFASADEQFRALGAKIPRQLSQAGYSKFGALNLNQFVADMASVDIRTSNEDQLGQRNKDGRKSARWEITAEGRRITYDPQWIRASGSIASVLALHEYLGVLGYQDKRYVASLGLWFLTRLEAHQVLNSAEISKIVSIISRNLSSRMAGGGVVGVGGGGQSMTLMYRAKMMLRCLDFFAGATSAADRTKVMNALLQLWLVPDEVTYERGTNPKVDFSLKP